VPASSFATYTLFAWQMRDAAVPDGMQGCQVSSGDAVHHPAVPEDSAEPHQTRPAVIEEKQGTALGKQISMV
jgi:hypothetical protein